MAIRFGKDYETNFNVKNYIMDHYKPAKEDVQSLSMSCMAEYFLKKFIVSTELDLKKGLETGIY